MFLYQWLFLILAACCEKFGIPCCWLNKKAIALRIKSYLSLLIVDGNEGRFCFHLKAHYHSMEFAVSSKKTWICFFLFL